MKRIVSWVNTLMGELEAHQNDELVKHIFLSCGADCAKKCGMDRVAVKTKEEIKDTEQFDEILKIIDKNFSGTFQPIEGGFTIEYGPWECDCEMVRQGYVKSSMLCNCTAGFHTNIWSEIFGRPVKVEIMEAVLRGGNICKLRVTFQEEVIE